MKKTPAKIIFPDWTHFTPEFADAELARLLPLTKDAIKRIEASKPTKFEELIYPLDDATHDLWTIWGQLSHILSVCNSDAWRKVQEKYQSEIVSLSLSIGQSLPLYQSAKRLLRRGGLQKGGRACHPVTAALSEARKRILTKMVQGAELAGVALTGKKKARFNKIAADLAKIGNDFMNEVIDTTTADIADAVYMETMKNCADEAKRKACYFKRIQRAPKNEARINELLKLRAEQAKILGFKTFADLSLATKCAPSVKAVMKMIDALDKATVKGAAADSAELAASCGRACHSVTAAPAPWNQSYLAERLREAKYAYSEKELREYFEFEKTLKGLFKLCKFLFGIEVREVKGRAKPSVWHPDVRFFEVRSSGPVRDADTLVRAHFYLDPYARPGMKSGGAWMNEFRNRSKYRGEIPLALVVLNLDKDNGGKGRTLMPMREVETLFHEFGHACQQMLTTITEADAAGINLVEWDAVEVASQFMENWCLDPRTGIKVPPALKAKVKAAKNFRAATACRRQLSFAKVDLLLHGAESPRNDLSVGRAVPCPPPKRSAKTPNDLKEEIFTHFGMPFVPEDRFLNSFTHIFSGGYSAGYYGYKWSEVMSADAYGAFEEAGLNDDKKVQALGRKYLKTILGLGGSKSALEVFKLFRGRAPKIDAILRQQGLK